MRKFLGCMTLVVLAASPVLAQGPGGPGGGRGFTPPPNPLMEALDVDKNGEISAEEIAGASAALKKLDKDGDGKLSGEEVRPPRPTFGGPGGGTFNAESMVARMMEQDKNGDGKLNAEELGERGARMLETGDTNKDGELDKAELEAFAKQMMERFRGGQGGRGGEGGERPARPEA